MGGTQNCGLCQKLINYIKKHMALSLPFLKRDSRKKRAQIIAIDLGRRTTKAVLIERRGEILALTRYALWTRRFSRKKSHPNCWPTICVRWRMLWETRLNLSRWRWA